MRLRMPDSSCACPADGCRSLRRTTACLCIPLPACRSCASPWRSDDRNRAPKRSVRPMSCRRRKIFRSADPRIPWRWRACRLRRGAETGCPRSRETARCNGTSFCRHRRSGKSASGSAESRCRTGRWMPADIRPDAEAVTASRGAARKKRIWDPAGADS